MRLWHRFGPLLAAAALLVVVTVVVVQFRPGGSLNPEPLKPCQLFSSDEIRQAGGDTWRGVQSDPTVPGECRWQASGVLLIAQGVDPGGQSFPVFRSSYAQAASVDGTQVTSLMTSEGDELFYYGSPPSPAAAKGVFAQDSRGDVVEIDVPAGRISERGLDSLATAALKRIGDS